MKDVRISRGYTQQALADELAKRGFENLTQPTIALIESGKPSRKGQGPRRVSLDDAVVIAAALGTSLESLTARQTWDEYLVWQAENPRPKEDG